jgi:hypothetical protein
VENALSRINLVYHLFKSRFHRRPFIIQNTAIHRTAITEAVRCKTSEAKWDSNSCPIQFNMIENLFGRCDAQAAGEEDHRDQHHARNYQSRCAKFIANAGLGQGGRGWNRGQLVNGGLS